jgi:flagellar assembly factor FliW
MITETKYFGATEYTEPSIIHFPRGLPGFEDLMQFLCIEQPTLRPLVYLQSLAEPDICFLTLPARAVDPTYRLELGSEESQLLQLGSEAPEIGKNIACMTILSTGKDKTATANLLAPVVINISRQIGVQVVQAQSGYDWTHPLGSAQIGEEEC